MRTCSLKSFCRSCVYGRSVLRVHSTGPRSCALCVRAPLCRYAYILTHLSSITGRRYQQLKGKGWDRLEERWSWL
jgi:hypothetical protein